MLTRRNLLGLAVVGAAGYWAAVSQAHHKPGHPHGKPTTTTTTAGTTTEPPPATTAPPPPPPVGGGASEVASFRLTV